MCLEAKSEREKIRVAGPLGKARCTRTNPNPDLPNAPELAKPQSVSAVWTLRVYDWIANWNKGLLRAVRNGTALRRWWWVCEPQTQAKTKGSRQRVRDSTAVEEASIHVPPQRELCTEYGVRVPQMQFLAVCALGPSS
jgi:hypothetical protein